MASDCEELFLTQSTFKDEDEEEDDTDKTFRFGMPLTEEELEDKLDQCVPKKTKYKNEWALSVFRRWQLERGMRPMTDNLSLPCRCLQQDVIEMSPDDLANCLKYFVFEAKKQDGTNYPASTIYGLFACFQSVLKYNCSSINIFDDPEFLLSRRALDAVMKERSAQGLGPGSRIQAEVITEEEEELLWTKGCLGDDTPRKLVDTILYLTGLHFSLRGGQEHRDLRMFNKPQITGPFVDSNNRSYLLYKEDVSKTNSGGLRHRKTEPKVVRAYDNPDDVSRCYVRLFQRYHSLCKFTEEEKTQIQAFYFTPLVKPKELCWYSRVPIGHNTLSNTVKRLCKTAGINGHRTNHSLRATSATRLFHANIPEQLICEQTGHRSGAVRMYKRTSEKQKLVVSDVLYGGKRKRQESATTSTAQATASVDLDSPLLPICATPTTTSIAPAPTTAEPIATSSKADNISPPNTRTISVPASASTCLTTDSVNTDMISPTLTANAAISIPTSPASTTTTTPTVTTTTPNSTSTDGKGPNISIVLNF